MRKVLILANEFPYGTWEPYMEAEEGHYSVFDKVWIASLQLRAEHARTRRKMKSRAEVIPVPYMPRIFYLLNSLTVLSDKELYKELKVMKMNNMLSLSRIVDLFVFLSRAHHEARVIDRILRYEDKENIVLYSYRFEYQPYVLILLRKKWKKSLPIISRAHRYDIYEDQHKNHYIPLRKYILDNLDYVFPCSEHGVNYIKEKYGNTKAKVGCKYLGTIDQGVRKCPSTMPPLKIVSCSNVVKVKKIEKIVNALSLIEDIEIEWTHYGAGPLFDQIRELAACKLKNNVKAIFPENVPNSKLLKLYAEEDYHVFLNVSSSEGLPVSIMEAMSFGIPCIATDVGGTSELVNSQNGILLNKDISDTLLADTIKNFCKMDMQDYIKLRENSRLAWEKSFNANANYQDFMNMILSF